VPWGRRSLRFASGGTKEAATAQPRTDELKLRSNPVRVNSENTLKITLGFITTRHAA